MGCRMAMYEGEVMQLRRELVELVSESRNFVRVHGMLGGCACDCTSFFLQQHSFLSQTLLNAGGLAVKMEPHARLAGLVDSHAVEHWGPSTHICSLRRVVVLLNLRHLAMPRTL
jgi:hypothetical protein